MSFRLNEINYNKIHDKFNKFYDSTNIIKIIVINKMKSFNLNLKPFRNKINLKIK